MTSGEENGTETPQAPMITRQEEVGWEIVDHDVQETPAPVHRALPTLGESYRVRGNRTRHRRTEVCVAV